MAERTRAGRALRRSGPRLAALIGMLLFIAAACAAAEDIDSGSPTVPETQPSPPTTTPTTTTTGSRSGSVATTEPTSTTTTIASTTAETTGAPPDPLAAAPIETVVPTPVSAAVGFSPGSVVLDLGADELQRDFDRMVDLGATWVRFDVDWSRIEREPGEFDWSRIDDLVIAARQRELHILGLLGYTPKWARPDGTPDKAPPVEPEDFARFVGEAVDRYRDHIRVWEIWNEPNVATFWHPAPDPQAYADLLVPAATVIRRADPDAIIVTGGLAPAIDEPEREISPATFLRQLYEATPLDAFDGVGVHPYTYPGFPTEQQPWNTFAALPELRQLMMEWGDGGTPMWFTEYGAPTGSGRRAVSEPDQARMIEEAIIGVREWDWAGPVFVYSLRDLADGPPDDIEANFGVLRADGSLKSAADTLHDLLSRAE